MNIKHLLPLLVLIILSGCATSPTGRSQLMLVSPDEAISASKQAYLQTLQPLAREGKIDSDRQMAERVRWITGRIIGQAIGLYPNTANWDWSIKVIDDPEVVNAWCMAGGKMAIYTGLINKVKPTDDELAQVLAHEISHALANHTAERMSVALASQLGIMTVGMATSNSRYGGAALSGSALAAAAGHSAPQQQNCGIRGRCDRDGTGGSSRVQPLCRGDTLEENGKGWRQGTSRISQYPSSAGQ